MATYDLKTFVVIAPNYYGKGRSIDEAAKAAVKSGWRKPRGKTEVVVIGTEAEYDEVEVRASVGVHVHVPNEQVLVKFLAFVA